MSDAIEKTAIADGITRLVGFFGAYHTRYGTTADIPDRVAGIPAFSNRTLNITSASYKDASGYKPVGNDLLKSDCRRATLLKAELTGVSSLVEQADFVMLTKDTLRH